MEHDSLRVRLNDLPMPRARIRDAPVLAAWTIRGFAYGIAHGRICERHLSFLHLSTGCFLFPLIVVVQMVALLQPENHVFMNSSRTVSLTIRISGPNLHIVDHL